MLVLTALLLICKKRRLGYPNRSQRQPNHVVKEEFQRGHTNLHHTTAPGAKTVAHGDLKARDVTSDNL